MSPYIKLRGWPEFSILLILGVALQFFDDYTLPQLFGPRLEFPLFFINLLPILVTGSVLVLFSSRWDANFEDASRARGVATQRAVVVVMVLAAWSLVAVLGYVIGVVPIQLLLINTMAAFPAALAFAARSAFSTTISTAIAMPVAMVCSFYPWLIGDTDLLGNTIGMGMNLGMAAVGSACFVFGTGVWITQGRMRR